MDGIDPEGFAESIDKIFQLGKLAEIWSDIR